MGEVFGEEVFDVLYGLRTIEQGAAVAAAFDDHEPSAYSDYTVATSSDKTDVAALFVKACRKRGLGAGFYYSPGWDKHHQPKRTPAEYEQFVHQQTTELLTHYGPIIELWFDIPWDMGPDMTGMLSRLYTHSNVYHNLTNQWGPQMAVDMDITAEAGMRWATDVEVKTAWLEVNLAGEKTFARATVSEFLDSTK